MEILTKLLRVLHPYINAFLIPLLGIVGTACGTWFVTHIKNRKH